MEPFGDPIVFLEKRIETTRRNIQATRTELKNLEDALVGYVRVLEMERKISGQYAPLFNIIQETTASLGQPEKEPSKADFARQFIRDNPHGVSPEELLKGFERASISIAKPYVYSLLQRLRDQQTIKQRRGRWYPVIQTNQDAAGAESNGHAAVEVLP
jgi:hypothetical protein